MNHKIDINEAYIKRLSKLAKLKLDDEERADIQNDLKQILGMVQKLQEVDTEGVEPLVYINEDAQVRVDKAHSEITQDQALKNAPDKDGPFFKVPNVINV